MAPLIRKAIGVLATTALFSATLLGVGCGGGDEGSERAVKWGIDAPVGRKWIRLAAPVGYCSAEPPRLERPIIEHSGDRVYIELRHTPEDSKGICFLQLLGLHKTITFNRDLNELVLFDASTDPPDQRWPTKVPVPTD